MYHLALVKAQEYDESENSMVLLRDSITIVERDVDQYDLRNPSIAGDLCEQIDQIIDGLAADAVFDAETPPDDGSSDDLDYPDLPGDDVLDEDVAKAEEQSIIDETLNRR